MRTKLIRAAATLLAAVVRRPAPAWPRLLALTHRLVRPQFAESDVADCYMLNGEVHFPPNMGRAVLDAVRPGAWPEKGVLDPRLGPHRNGRKW